ncbi:MAG: beta-lactamase family protein [Clostridia bacterium]|nr:beta-lactamase family protein [Clostridia bacterium]
MDFTHLTAYLDRLSATEGIPASHLAVCLGGREIYRHRTGYQDPATGEPLRPDALYFMYSASKLITVVAAMQLLERGKFIMHDPIAQYLPEFAHAQVKLPDGQGGYVLRTARPIRIRHLFNMTSGIGFDIHAPALRACIDAHNGAPSTADVIRAIAEQPLECQPGEHWLYGFSHDVLLRLVEVIAGEPFSAYAKKHIFDPVGMNDTYYHLTDDLRPRMAEQYRFDARLGRAVAADLSNDYVFGPRYESGGAGVISCLDDFLRLAETLTHGGKTPGGERILAEQTVNLMRTDCLDAQTRPSFNWDILRGYGYGFGVRTLIAPEMAGTLSSPGEFGWGGAAGAYVHCDPAREISIVYLQHMLNSKDHIVQPRLRNLIYSALEY